MRRLAAVVLVALVSATAASAGPLPSPDAPNLTSVLLPQLVSAPLVPQQLSFQQLQPIWQAAGQAYGVPWSVLAAINKIESNFGQNMGPSSAGAIGWMQFMPDTWARWGIDADGDGIADPWDPQDAIYSAARYLAASGAATDIASAVFSYNHAQWYVDEVLQLAQGYDSGGADFSNALQSAQQQLDAAKQAVVDASQRLLGANALMAKLQAGEDQFLATAQNTPSFSDRLEAQKAGVLLDIQLQAAQADAPPPRARRSPPVRHRCSARRATPTATSSRLPAARASSASVTPTTTTPLPTLPRPRARSSMRSPTATSRNRGRHRTRAAASASRSLPPTGSSGPTVTCPSSSPPSLRAPS